MCPCIFSDAHHLHQSVGLAHVPEIQKGSQAETDVSSFCSTSVEEDLRKVSVFAVLDMFVSQRHIIDFILRVFLTGTNCFDGCCLVNSA